MTVPARFVNMTAVPVRPRRKFDAMTSGGSRLLVMVMEDLGKSVNFKINMGQVVFFLLRDCLFKNERKYVIVRILLLKISYIKKFSKVVLNTES